MSPADTETPPPIVARYAAKIEVLNDLEPLVKELMAAHEAKRVLWFPAQVLEAPPGEDPDRHLAALRERARGISDPARVALALNLLTEEGLPHFHRLLGVYLGTDNHWAVWNNLWTAEEDRHGALIHDYTRDAGIFDPLVIEKMQFDYIRAGFEPEWDRDPYRVFVYTSLQERATQVSHANTGKFASQNEPTIGTVLQKIANEEARHYTFYRSVFKAVLERDPNEGLAAAARIMPAINMPGVSMPHFRDLSDVVRRAEIYGPRDYQRIVEELIKYWSIETIAGVHEMGRKAQEKIMGIPARLERIAQAMELKTKPRSFAFDVIYNREFGMD